MKIRESEIFYPVLWFFMAVICFMGQWWIFRDAVYPDQPSVAGTALKGVAEGAVLLSWYWLLSPRFRWCVIIPLWISGLLFIANALYFRVFEDIIPLSAVTMTDNFNALFFRSGLALLKWSDLFQLIIPALLTTIYVTLLSKRVRTGKIPLKGKLFAICVCLLLWCFQQFIYIKGVKQDSFVAVALGKGEKGLTWRESFGFQWSAPNFNNAHDLHSRGVALYTLREIHRTFMTGTSSMALSDKQRDTIEDYLSDLPKDYPLPAVFANRDSMNVVLIIVESLNSWVFDMRINGEEVTPNLNALIKEPTTIFVGNVRPETRDGGSSDGQLLYDTGLLPLSRGAAAMSYADNVYPSLAKTLGRPRSLMFIGDSKKVWNYEKVSKQYGYDRLYDEGDLPAAGMSPKTMGGDRAILSFAADVLTKTPQPFFAEIITLSMHLPFKEGAARRVDAFEKSGHSATFNDYVTATRFFDEQFALFVSKLKEAGVYDNTIIFLASDHDIIVLDDGREKNRESLISFIAVNAGDVTLDVNGEVRQSDIFPTMLDVAGRGDADWKGLGISVFAGGARKKQDKGRSESAQTVTDLIIKGNYFNKQDK